MWDTRRDGPEQNHRNASFLELCASSSWLCSFSAAGTAGDAGSRLKVWSAAASGTAGGFSVVSQLDYPRA